MAEPRSSPRPLSLHVSAEVEPDQRGATTRRPKFDEWCSLGAWALATAIIGSFGPVVRIAAEGSGATPKATALGLCALAWAVVLWIRSVVRPGVWITLGVAAGAASAYLVVASTGRAPMVVTCMGVWCAHVAMSPSHRPVRAWSGAAIVVAANLAWAATGVTLLSVITMIAAIATCTSTPRAVVGQLQPIDARVERAFSTCRRSLRLAAVRVAERSKGHLALVPVADLVLGTIAALISVPAFNALIRHGRSSFGINDYPIHLELARQMELWPPSLVVPHPVFHASVRLADVVVGRTWSGVFVMSMSVGFGVVALARWFAGTDTAGLGATPTTAGTAAALFYLIESPAVLLIATGLAPRGTPFQPFHIWGNPTDVFVLPMLFVLVPAVVAVTAADRSPSRSDRALLTGLVVLVTATKPSYTLVLLPALPLWLWSTRAGGRQNRRVIVGNCLVPGALVVVAQTILQTSGALPLLSNGFTIDPLALIDSFGWTSGGWVFWLALAVPITAAAIGGRAFISDRTTQLILWTFLIAWIPALLLRETGGRSTDGNLAKSGYFAWVLLAAWSTRYLVLSVSAAAAARRSVRSSRLPLWAVAAGSLGLIGGLAGVVSYFDLLGVLDIGLDWNVKV